MLWIWWIDPPNLLSLSLGSSSSSQQQDSNTGSAVTASSSNNTNNTPHINVRNDSLNTTASLSAASTLSLASSSLSSASTLVVPQHRKGSNLSDHHHYHMLDTASMFSEYKKSTTSTLGRKGKEASHRHYPRRSIKVCFLVEQYGRWKIFMVLLYIGNWM